MAQLKQEYRRKNTFFRNWGAVVILIVFFLASWGGQLMAQIQVEKQNSQQHGQEFSMQEFWPKFWSATLENWQSEWLQLATQAVLVMGLSTYVMRKQSEEHYKTHLMIEDLQDQIKQK